MDTIKKNSSRLYLTILAIALSVISLVFTIQFFLGFSASLVDSAVLVALAVCLEIVKFVAFPLAKGQVSNGNYIMSGTIGLIGIVLLGMSMFASWHFLTAHYEQLDDVAKVKRSGNEVRESIVESKKAQIKTLTEQVEADMKSDKVTRANKSIEKISVLEKELLNMSDTTATTKAELPTINKKLREVVIILVSVVPDLSAILLFLIIGQMGIGYSDNKSGGMRLIEREADREMIRVMPAPSYSDNYCMEKVVCEKADTLSDNVPTASNVCDSMSDRVSEVVVGVDNSFLNRVKAKIEKGIYAMNVDEIAKVEKKSRVAVSQVLEALRFKTAAI